MFFNFLRKIIKNKIIVMIISILTICTLVCAVRKIIDNYEFELYNSENIEVEEVIEKISEIENKKSRT